MAQKATSDLITITAALKEFKVARSTLFKALKAGELKRYVRGGDRSVYLSRKGIKEWRTFREEGTR